MTVETNASIAAEIRRHCDGCTECQCDRSCGEYQRLRSRHFRIAEAEGDKETLRSYHKEDEESAAELQYEREHSPALHPGA